MRIMLRALLMMTFGLLVLGMLGLALWTQVIAAAPSITPPTSPEELVKMRRAMPIQLTNPIDPEVESIELWPESL
jgi:hypothetical protein